MLEPQTSIYRQTQSGTWYYFVTNLIGAHESGDLGENLTSPKQSLALCFTSSSWQAKSKVRFGDDYDTEDGTGVRDLRCEPIQRSR